MSLLPHPLPHALLIVGPVDSLLKSLAPELQSLLCEKNKISPSEMQDTSSFKKELSSACTGCISCQLYGSEAGHPDFRLFSPEGKTHIIKIDSVRSVLDFLAESSLRGGLKIVVFSEADALNIASQNALLKSLEEPQAQRLIILLTEKPHLLLPTIKSRCQTLKALPFEDQPQSELSALFLKPFEIMDSAQKLKDAPLYDVLETQMRIVYDMTNKIGQNALSLHQFYDSLLETQAILQKQVAINQELMLLKLLIQWKKHFPST